MCDGMNCAPSEHLFVSVLVEGCELLVDAPVEPALAPHPAELLRHVRHAVLREPLTHLRALHVAEHEERRAERQNTGCISKSAHCILVSRVADHGSY